VNALNQKQNSISKSKNNSQSRKMLDNSMSAGK